MIELTLDQVRALAQAGTPPTVMDPTTRQVYVLMPTDAPSPTPDAPLETPVEPWKHLVGASIPGGSNSTSRAGT